MKNDKANAPSQIVKAEYKKQLIEEYCGNPLIEALPSILSMDEIVDRIHYYPHCSPEERNLEPELRYHCVQRLFRYFQPLDIHLDIEQRMSRIIRQGYLSRNPISPAYASDLQKIYGAIKDKDVGFQNIGLSPASASGFTIIGFSGVGKTTAIEKVLSLYPQVILHSRYNSVDLNHYQIVWLKLDCPFDGSVKGLCANFFMEFDRLLGDNTYSKFASGRNTTTDTMIPRMAQITRRHSLGILVIDEIQHLSMSKSGGTEKMLNFFVTLVNTIGIPVILIGTTKAIPILQGDFRQARRSSGQQGDIIWESMAKDERWELLIEGMWGNQWTKNRVDLSKELMDVLYDESQGIVDIAVKLYAMAQIRAIASGRETITPTLIRQVAKDNLKLVRPMLQALKSGDKRAISKYEDIRPIDIDAFCAEQLKTLDMNQQIKRKMKERILAKQPDDSVFEDAVIQLIGFDVSEDAAKKAVEQTIRELGKDAGVNIVVKTALKRVLAGELSKENKSIKRSVRKIGAKDPNDLRYIVEEGRKEGKTAYEALKSRGYIKNPVEEFIRIG